MELSAAQRTHNAETMRELRVDAGELVVEAGQVWEHIGSHRIEHVDLARSYRLVDPQDEARCEREGLCRCRG